MEEPKFTREELEYIEKIMDNHASYGIEKLEKIREIIRIGTDSKIEKETIEQMEMDVNRSWKVSKSIRDKIEKWRCAKEQQGGTNGK